MEIELNSQIDIIICTRNREKIVKKLIHQIATLEKFEIAKIIIVDSSDSKFKNNDFDSKILDQLKVIYSKPGLPTQRNFGLSESFSPFVVFLDDDVELPQKFLVNLLKEFATDPMLVGLGFSIYGIDYSKINFISSKLGIRRSLNSKFGQVTLSGKNFWYPSYLSNVAKGPMWIPGCAMAFRRSGITNLFFNPDLEKGVTGGYALGEDVDFTLRLFQSGAKLNFAKEIIVNHYLAPGERDDALKLARAEGAWLRYLSETFPSIAPSPIIFFRLIFQLLFSISYWIFKRSNGNYVKKNALRLWHFLIPSPYSTKN